MNFEHIVYKNKDEILSKLNDIITLRKSKQPYEFPSCGSVFKRLDGVYISKLIDELGLKWKQIGGAKVSEKHAGFIVNVGSATCSDVRRLIEEVRNEVFLRTSVKLETEIKTVGRLWFGRGERFMSFSAEVKSELSLIERDDCCQRAQLAAMVQLLSSLTIGNGGLQLMIRSENPTIAKTIWKLIR